MVVAAVVMAVAAHPGGVSAQEYHVDVNADNVVRFMSHATIDDFEGVTGKIDGYVLLDGQGVRSAGTPIDGSELYFEVDLASLDTGIGLRNRHMRDNYLEVDEHPYASFKGTVDRIESTASGWRVTSSGTFGVHGVDRDRTLTCDAAPEGDGFHVQCGFQVLLSDHDIEIPKVMFLKLANEIQLELDFHIELAGAQP